jgi:cytidine deaminase
MLEPDIEKLIDAARAVQGAFALEEPDFSAASVGAALRTTSGAIYTGVCIDLACGIGFCAEHAAIAEMLKHREVEIDAIVAVNNSWILPPCGRCREAPRAWPQDQSKCAMMACCDGASASLPAGRKARSLRGVR